MYAYFTRYRKTDKEPWQNTALTSKERSDENVDFLTAYGYTARTCIADDGRTGLKERG